MSEAKNAHNYIYYPGCSQEHAGIPYDMSSRAVMNALGSPMKDIEDWNCCGATAYFSIKEFQAFALSARNMALAEKAGATDIITICNACFGVMNKTAHYLHEKHNTLKPAINNALAEVGLHYEGKVKVRHLLDVNMADFGPEFVKSKVTKKLDGLKIAPYYGCLFSRPLGDIDAPENPTMMNKLFNAIGAPTIEWEAKTRCCGGLILQVNEEVALRLNDAIIMEAVRRGANVIATACPLCHVNLELTIEKIREKHPDKAVNISIMFFTQILGMALGVSPRDLGVDMMLSLEDEAKKLLASAA